MFAPLPDESEEGAGLPGGYNDEDDEHKDEDDAEIVHEGWSFHARPGCEVGGVTCCDIVVWLHLLILFSFLHLERMRMKMKVSEAFL